MNKIGIICAMKNEMDILLNALGEGRKVKMLGCTFYEGEIGGHNVVLCISGVGKVNAAIATTLLINEFKATLDGVKLAYGAKITETIKVGIIMAGVVSICAGIFEFVDTFALKLFYGKKEAA